MKKNNAKRTVVVIALIALMAIPSMMAYFTDVEKSENNTFTTGDIEITLDDSAFKKDCENEYVVPGCKLGNETVTNDGKNPAYVFAKVTYTGAENLVDYDVNGNAEGLAAGWYYLGELQPEASTTVFGTDGVVVPTTLTNPEISATEDENELKGIEFDIEVHAIQSQHLTKAEAATQLNIAQ